MRIILLVSCSIFLVSYFFNVFAKPDPKCPGPKCPDPVAQSFKQPNVNADPTSPPYHVVPPQHKIYQTPANDKAIKIHSYKDKKN